MEYLEYICGHEEWVDALTVEKITVLVVFMALCGVTIFRKELSANHVYAEELHREKAPDEKYSPTRRARLLPVNSEQIISGAKEFYSMQQYNLRELYISQQDGLRAFFSSLSTENIISGATEFYHKQQERLLELYLRQSDYLYERYSWFLTCSANPPSVSRLLELRLELEMHWKTVLGESKSPFSFLSNLIYVAYYGSSESKQDENDGTGSGKSFLGLMPAEIAAFCIMSYLSSEELFTMAQVSHGFQKFADSDAVWKVAWRMRFKGVWESAAVRSAASLWHCHLDERQNNYPILPTGMTWKFFFNVFELSWLDWVLAGCNSESLCLIGIHGSIFDVTQFLNEHPGSPDTLMEKSGRNSTEIFEDVGHSSLARELMMNYLIVNRPEPVGIAILSSVREFLQQNALLYHESLITRCQWDCTKPPPSSGDPRPPPPLLLTCSNCQERINPVTSNREVCSYHKGDIIPVFNPLLSHWYAWATCCGVFIHVE